MKTAYFSIAILLAVSAILTAQSNWTLQFTGVADSMAGVDYGNGQFGAISKRRIITSPDGASWTPSGSLGSFRYSDNRAIQYTGIHWFARDLYGNGRIYLSTTLPSLANPTLPGNGNETFRAAASGNGALVVVGRRGQIRASANGGSSWLIAASPTQEDLVDVIFDGTSFIALGSRSAILQSINGLTWTQKRDTSSSNLYEDLEFGQGSYVAVGRETMRSVDLESWSESSHGALKAVEYANGKFVAVGDQGEVVMSLNGGLSWTPVDAGVTANLRGVAFGKGHWVAVGGNGLVIRAPDDDSAEPQEIDLTIHPAVEIRWPTLASHSYQVHWSYDMETWFDFGGPIAGDGTTKSALDRTLDADNKFYRVTQIPSP